MGSDYGKLDFKDLISMEQLDAGQIDLILQNAAELKRVLERDIKKVPTLRGRTVLNLFYENSTRTRTSFELAGKYMSADVVNINAAASSVSKGESLRDTGQTLNRMAADLIVIRHPMSGAPAYLGRTVSARVINGGDGLHQHPTQSLLDLYTARDKLGDLKGMKVAIVGDVLHSRVARSNLSGFRTMGAEVWLCGPPTLMPPGLEDMGAKITWDMDEAVRNAQAVMMLRIQRERQASGLFPSIREYSQRYGLNARRLKLADSGCLVMHPGPMNRGVEISGEIADGVQSVIEEQVTNGVAVRMALLYLMAGRKGGDGE
ncbi:MAG: aspartate carbamoyltransferase catalytic subunit [Peptococcaceae bacterium]|jgi:aspartate carbamoyltransferase catalytic subunit|nr:aspartate carbamoyltransferase catalytic subunit [Peptococcaceae bacterium]